MSQEQAAAAVIIAIISKKTSQEKRDKKEKSVWNHGLKKEKLRILWNYACRAAVRRRI